MRSAVLRPATDRGAISLAVAASACWGIGIVVAKAGLDRGLPPLSFAAGQLVASVVVLSAVAFLAGSNLRPAIGQLAAVSGVIEYGFAATLVVIGVSLTSVGNAAIINASEPVLIVLAAIVLLRERLGWRFLLPVTAMVVGLLAVMAPDLAETGAPRSGDLFVLASAVLGALYAVLSRRLVGSVPPLPLAIVQQASGLAILALLLAAGLAAGLVEPGLSALSDPTVIALVVGSGLLQHGAAVWLHLAALRRMPASVFAIYLGLVPVFALLGGLCLLGEPVTPGQILGGGLVIVAAIFSARTPKEPNR